MSQPPPPPPPPEHGQPYGQEGYGQGYAPAQQTSSKAIIALVLGIASFFVCGLFLSIPAIIVGRMATREIDASGGRMQGRGMATAGFVLGIINVVVSIIALIVVVVVLSSGSTNA